MEITVNKQNSLSFFKRLFGFSGRATRKEFWLTALGLTVAMIVFGTLGKLLDGVAGGVLSLPFYLLMLATVVAGWSNAFRRLHDLGLSGFWTCYLTPLGLFIMLVAYLMDVDQSTTGVIERIKNMGSPWLGWILAGATWPLGSLFGFLFVLLMPGKKEDNLYGPNPYPEA